MIWQPWVAAVSMFPPTLKVIFWTHSATLGVIPAIFSANDFPIYDHMHLEVDLNLANLKPSVAE